MTQKEKAKAYDEAIERAKKINSGEGVEAPPDWTTCEVIFPELKENEDEMMRKECISIIDAWDKSCRLQGDYCEVAPKCIAWLEKQGDKDKLIQELGEYKVKYTQEVLNQYLEKQGEQEKPQVYETEDGEIITYSETDGYKVVEPKFHEGEWSEEQIGVIKAIINYMSFQRRRLDSLYEQLKKLRKK